MRKRFGCLYALLAISFGLPTRADWAPNLATGFAKSDQQIGDAIPAPSAGSVEASAIDPLRQIERGRTFSEPLVPVGEPSVAESASLSRALDAYHVGRDVEAFEPLLAFLRDYPGSAWQPSLLANLAVLYRHTGYIDRALDAAGEAWRLTAASSDPRVKKIADSALATRIELTAALGRTAALADLLAIVAQRPLGGHAAEVASNARTGLWLMRRDPGGAFRCGPLAIERLSQALYPGRPLAPELLSYPSTTEGTSLGEIARLAARSGIDLTPIQRQRGSAVPVPAVVHWKAGHFAAIVAQDGQRFLAKDLTFGDDHWISRRALEEESTGYMLVVHSTAGRSGWRPVGYKEASTVRGRGATGNPNPGATYPQAPKKPKLPGDCGAGGRGMPSYNFHTAVVSLNVTDQPLGYTPPRGPAIEIGITYNSREDFQPATFTFSNLGSRWSFDWLTYVEDDDPNNAGQTVRLAERGGGSFILPHVQSTPSGAYGPNVAGYHEMVTRTTQNGITVGFVRQYPDGSQDVYGKSDNATTQRKYFLTSTSDSAGNTVSLNYDTSLRLVSIVDAIGQQTTLSYGLTNDPYKITAVSDPFGRQAIFQYAASQLASVTDAVGMKSSFGYGPTPHNTGLAVDFLNAMTTPYGTTTFDMGEYPPAVPSDIGNVRWLLATDPVGNQERVEFAHEASGIVGATAEAVPAGFGNQFLQYRNSFYWNRTAMQQYRDSDPNRYLNATFLFHWLHDTTGGGSNIAASSIPESTQTQGQHRIWFAYPGQVNTFYQGSLSTPTRIAQVLDGGQEQNFAQTYDLAGRVQTVTDSIGRKASYHYAANGVDLTSIRNDQANGGTGDQLLAITYNTNHQPLTITDYAGQTSSATYNAYNQVTSVRRPDGVTINLTYDARGFLMQTARAGTSYTETYTYDGENRVRTWTSTDGYTLTFDYDNLDRLTRITYPDGSSDVVVLDRLDVVQVQDRLGRLSRYAYDSADRLVSSTDPANRTTTYSWCGCGSLDQLTDPLGHRTKWLRDDLNRPVARQLNDRTVEQYAYDGSGRLIRRIDALGQATNYFYGVDNNPAGRTYQSASRPTASVSLFWDPIYPRLALISDGTGTTNYTYYPAGVLGAGKVASITTPAPGHVVTFQYDTLGRRSSYAVDGAAVTFTFDNLDRLAATSSPLGNITGTYDGTSDRPTSIVYGNGMGATLTYFDATHDFRVARLHWGPAGAYNLSQFDYTYDGAQDRILSRVWHDATNPAGRFFSFAFDPAGQLIGRQETSDPGVAPVTNLHSLSYGYDLVGNRTNESIDSSITLSTFDADDKQLTIERSLSVGAVRAIEAARERRTVVPPSVQHPASDPQGDRP
jgi:YD repeat-containing protein